jgi:hypothetical protein
MKKIENKNEEIISPSESLELVIQGDQINPPGSIDSAIRGYPINLPGSIDIIIQGGSLNFSERNQIEPDAEAKHRPRLHDSDPQLVAQQKLSPPSPPAISSSPIIFMPLPRLPEDTGKQNPRPSLCPDCIIL